MINYKILGISFSIPNGVATVGGGVLRSCPSVSDHGTVWAQGLLENIKWAWGPYRRWSRHLDENQDTLTAIGFHRRYPEAIFRDRVRKLGMDF